MRDQRLGVLVIDPVERVPRSWGRSVLYSNCPSSAPDRAITARPIANATAECRLRRLGVTVPMGDNDCLYCRPCVLSSTLSRVNNPASATATAPVSAPQSLIERCRHEAIRLLRRNASDAGILAASRGARAHSRGYDAVFGRDAAICAIGMALSGDPVLEKCAAVGLETIGAHQAPNGQIPKFVDTVHQEPDFWYLGCIDATLWWLIALEFLDRVRNEDTLRTRHRQRIARAIDWLLAQEHQRFRLLQQNEASDWADIMPRSGFVLYTNALWYRVKCLFDVPHATDTAENINGLFHPFSASLHEYRRGEPIDVYNHGEMWRDFTYVDDLVRGIGLLIDAVPPVPGSQSAPIAGDSLSPVAPYRIVNIGNSEKVRLLDFIKAIEDCTGCKAECNYMDMQPGDVPATWANANLLKELTGYRPQTPVREGVARFVAWYREFHQV